MKLLHLILAFTIGIVSSVRADQISVSIQSLTVNNRDVPQDFEYLVPSKKEEDSQKPSSQIAGLFMPRQLSIFLEELSTESTKARVLISERFSTPATIEIFDSPRTTLTATLSPDGDLQIATNGSEKFTVIFPGQTVLFKSPKRESDTTEFRLVTIKKN